MAFVKEFLAFFEKNIDLDKEKLDQSFTYFYVGGRKNILKKCTFLYIFAQKHTHLIISGQFMLIFTLFFLPILPKPYKPTLPHIFLAEKQR